MELVFMGTGTSTGVPMIGVGDHDCDLNNSKNWRTRSCAHLVMDGTHIQVDVSPEFRLQCLWNKIEWIDFVILTHGHSDHIMGMDDLRRFCVLKDNEAILVYSGEDGLTRLRASFEYAIRDVPIVKGYPAFKPIDMPEVLELGCGKVYSTILPHGPFEVLGLVFEEKSTGKRVAYYTDCHEVTSKAYELARDVDLLVIDALRHEPHPSHLTVDRAVQISREIGAKQAYLTHMGHWVDHESVNEGLPDGVELAYDGLRVTI